MEVRAIWALVVFFAFLTEAPFAHHQFQPDTAVLYPGVDLA